MWTKKNASNNMIANFSYCLPNTTVFRYTICLSPGWDLYSSPQLGYFIYTRILVMYFLTSKNGFRSSMIHSTELPLRQSRSFGCWERNFPRWGGVGIWSYSTWKTPPSLWSWPIPRECWRSWRCLGRASSLRLRGSVWPKGNFAANIQRG